MKIPQATYTEAKPAKVKQDRPAKQNTAGTFVLLIFSLMALSLSTMAESVPAIRFILTQGRVTVPVNSTNSTTITNFVNLVNGAASASFTISELPAGAGVALTDTNGNVLTSTTADTNLWVTVNTTNVAEGVYTFWLNATGLDTNGLTISNSFPFVLQVAHIWNGTLDNAASWSSAASWLGGVPTAADDVVFADQGAQTNSFSDTTSLSFTNSFIDADTTIGSLRFAQTGLTNTTIAIAAGATNPPAEFHHIHIAAGKTLTITGTNGFSLMRDYFDDAAANLGTMGVTISGDAGAKLVLSNQTANATVFVGGNLVPTLNMSNLNTLIVNVSRIGFGDYRIYPNYSDINTGINAGRDATNYSARPRQMSEEVYLAATNFITANYKDPENYTNEFNRNYALTVNNNEQNGVGSSANGQVFVLGATNRFLMDGICFYGANGNGSSGGVQFSLTNSGAVFRNTNGIGRMSVFTESDDGGTNEASSNVKGFVNFSGNNGFVDILADRFYLARDRELIASNQTPNVQADFVMGKGIIDVNTAVLGFQEHIKPDWNIVYPGSQPYLNYCEGRLVVTNSGTFKVNGTLTLGYTGDTNDPADAEQYGTFGQINIYSNSVVMASNIVVDGGLNFYDTGLHLSGQPTPRANTITLNPNAILIVSNSIGGDNYTGSQYPTFANTGSPGLPLDTLTIASGATLTLFVSPGKTNVFVRNLASSGTTPGIIKIASLSGVSSYPVTLPLIAYQTAAPFLAADMSAIGGNAQGYILNDTANQTIDLFLTTNAPDTLTWTGSINNKWDLTTRNWVTSGGVQTNFSMGDIAIFDDSSTVTNIDIVDVVVPNQSTNGVVITNSTRAYEFNPAGGAIAGTAKILKQGSGGLIFNASEAGPITVMAGEIDVSGSLGSATLASNTVLHVLSSGTVNGLNETRSTVTVARAGAINGLITLTGGSLVNDGTLSAPTGSEMIQTNNAALTNNLGGVINLGGSNPQYEEFAGSTLANFGVIAISGGRFYINGLYYGTGTFYDPINGPTSSALARFEIRDNPNAVISPGDLPNNSIGNMFMGGRVDLSTDNNPANNAPTFLVEVDNINHINDTLTCTKWNNIGCIWAMTNLNGAFQSGQSFQVLVNASGPTNFVDTPTIYPLMQPTVPGPGLQWNLSAVQLFGIVAVTNSTMIWDGGGNHSWDTNNSPDNWQGGQFYGDNQGAIFDDSASGSTDVILNTPVAPAGLNVVTVTNIVTGVSTNIVTTTNTPSFMPGIVVDNTSKDYTIEGPGKITGMTSLYKTGSGTLSLLTSNDFTGGMVIEGGTLAITNITALGKMPAQRLAYVQLLIDDATMKFFGATNQNLGQFVTIHQNGATFEVSSNTTELTLNQAILGPGTLTKTGPGTIVMSQGSDNYGGTVVNAGTVRLTTPAIGTNSLTLNNDATLQLTNAFTLTNVVNVAGPDTAVFLLGVSTNIVIGPWSGNGTVTFASTNASRAFVFNDDLSGFNGTISFGNSIGLFRFNNSTNSNPCTGSVAATFDLGTGSATLNNFNGSNLVYNLGALAGGANTTLSGAVTNVQPPGTTYSIGANGGSTVFAGKITDGLDTVTVNKVGSGTLLLDGDNTYSGDTTVSAGALGGAGSIAGNLIVQSTGALTPGDSIGTFTVGGTATLAGNVTLEINQANAATNDMLAVSGAITASGPLVVTNVGPDIVNGSTFKLFNKAVFGLAVTLPAKDPSGVKNYVWNDNITADGSIQLVSGGSTNSVSTTPTNIVATVSGNTLTLSWPQDHTGWTLEAQTNSLSVGISTNWVLIAGSTSTNEVNMTIDPNNGAVFYRLIYQP